MYAEALPCLSAAAAQRAARPAPPLRALLWRVPTLRELALHKHLASANNSSAHKAALAIGWLECSDDGLGMFLCDDSARLRVELAHVVPEHFLLCRRARVAVTVAAAVSASASGDSIDGADRAKCMFLFTVTF